MSDITSGKINQKIMTVSDMNVIKSVKKWVNGDTSFAFLTSGSTGDPKNILLTRSQLEYSAITTNQFLFQERGHESTLICLSTERIGGFQLLIRSILSDCNVHITSPKANPIEDLDQPIDLISLVPYQLQEILKSTPDKLRLLKTVLIGGAEIPPSLEQRLLSISDVKFYETFGMTETASHFALRKIGDSNFTLVGDVRINSDDSGRMKIQGSVTNSEWIQTNDIIEIVDTGFKWVGRSDWTINSAGIKIQPEVIEKKIRSFGIESELAITGAKDEKFGEAVTLITTSQLLSDLLDMKVLDRIEIPKSEILVDKIPKLPNGKIDRLGLRRLANE